MSTVSVREKCSCGAEFSASGSSYRSSAGGGSNGQHRSAEEMAERWRTDHKHEMPGWTKLGMLELARDSLLHPEPHDSEEGR